MPKPEISSRIDALHAPGLVDMHFDLLMDLYEKRHRTSVLADDYLADWQAGGIGVVAAALYIEDRYLPEMGLRVALDQIALLYEEVARTPDFAICRTSGEIEAARRAGRIAAADHDGRRRTAGHGPAPAARVLRTRIARRRPDPCPAQCSGRGRRVRAEGVVTHRD